MTCAFAGTAWVPLLLQVPDLTLHPRAHDVSFWGSTDFAEPGSFFSSPFLGPYRHPIQPPLKQLRLFSCWNDSCFFCLRSLLLLHFLFSFVRPRFRYCDITISFEPLRACLFHKRENPNRRTKIRHLRRYAIRLCGSWLHGRHSTRQGSTAWRGRCWRCSSFDCCSPDDRRCCPPYKRRGSEVARKNSFVGLRLEIRCRRRYRGMRCELFYPGSKNLRLDRRCLVPHQGRPSSDNEGHCVLTASRTGQDDGGAP